LVVRYGRNKVSRRSKTISGPVSEDVPQADVRQSLSLRANVVSDSLQNKIKKIKKKRIYEDVSSVLLNPWVKLKPQSTKTCASNKNQNINLLSAKTSTLHQPKSKQTYLDHFYFFITITIDHRIFPFLVCVAETLTNCLRTQQGHLCGNKLTVIGKRSFMTTVITVPKSLCYKYPLLEYSSTSSFKD
jgi:hypothetical protein